MSERISKLVRLNCRPEHIPKPDECTDRWNRLGLDVASGLGEVVLHEFIDDEGIFAEVACKKCPVWKALGVSCCSSFWDDHENLNQSITVLQAVLEFAKEKEAGTMGADSKIQWTDHTFNPWRGCTRISAGCENCYAEVMAHRNPRVLGVWGDDGTRVVASESYWQLPVRWNQKAKDTWVRRRVFCASLADVFENRPELDKPRHRLRHLIDQTPYLDWLLLTKRPENVKLCYGGPEGHAHRSWIESWPTNAWLGVSVEDQKSASNRIPVLLDVPAKVRFLSVEPLLQPIDLSPWIKSLDWVIVGGESGPAARACEEVWIQSIVSQCKDADVPVFVKQMGSRFYDNGWRWGHKDKKGGDPSEWPEHLRVREFPKAKV